VVEVGHELYDVDEPLIEEVMSLAVVDEVMILVDM
jgi:hypothetical protein